MAILVLTHDKVGITLNPTTLQKFERFVDRVAGFRPPKVSYF